MDTKNVKPEGHPSEIVDILNQALQLEYTLVVHYPRLASLVQDKEMKELVLRLGHDSINHADVVASAIMSLGGTARWSFAAFPDVTDLVKVFETQLQKEKMALELHRKSSEMTPDSSLRDRLRDLAQAEVGHIRIVRDILSSLAGHSPDS